LSYGTKSGKELFNIEREMLPGGALGRKVTSKLLTYLLTYFDHTASQAIGTEMHAYTIGNVHAIELRSSKNNEQNLRGIITLLSSFLAFIHNRRQSVYSLVQVAKSCVDSCTVT